jgi:hypothetical protein
METTTAPASFVPIGKKSCPHCGKVIGRRRGNLSLKSWRLAAEALLAKHIKREHRANATEPTRRPHAWEKVNRDGAERTICRTCGCDAAETNDDFGCARAAHPHVGPA